MPIETCCPFPETDGFIILIFILIGALVYWWVGRWMTGEAKAVSGHTIEIGRKEQRVRLHALYSLQPPFRDRPGQPWTDAAGTKHDGGVIAKGMLAQQIAGKNAKVRREQEGKSFDRYVGRVFVGCEDVGLWMVANGYAFAAKPRPEINEKIRKRYEKAERKAKRKGRGFHSGKFEDPLEWIRPKIKESFEGYHGNPERLAKEDPKGFVDLAKKIAEEIGEEMLVEWAIEFTLLV